MRSRFVPRWLPVPMLLVMTVMAAGCTKTHIETTTESIPYNTVEKNDSSMWEDESSHEPGAEGVMEVTWGVTYRGDDEVDRARVGEQVAQEPVDEVYIIGTKSPLTGRAVSLGDGLSLTVQGVRRTSSVQTWQGHSVTGGFLIVEFRLDNNSGLAESISSRQFALVYDRDGVKTIAGGMYPQSSSGADGGRPRDGEYTRFVAAFDLYNHLHSTGRNTSLSDPSEITLLYQQASYEKLPVPFQEETVSHGLFGPPPKIRHKSDASWPLSDFWRKPL